MSVNQPDSKLNITSSDTQVREIYDLLKKGDEETKLSSNKDIVLILGNTGSGKSTFTQYVTDGIDTLISQEVGETGDFLIVDREDKISKNATIISKTIFPEMVLDSKTNTTYYDCPGFSDSRSAAHEIAETYLIKKVIDSAKSVKLVFVVSHHAVREGADRKDFPLMLKHVIDFVKKADKFKNSFVLVVTKVENTYRKNGRVTELVPDEKVINAIGNYLKQVKKDISDIPQLVGSNSKDSQDKILTFLGALLDKQGEIYTRIGIFRRPDQAGPLRDIELLKNGKASLQNMISKNIQFAKVADEDFGYTVSSESKLYVNSLVEEITNTIFHKLVSLGNEMVQFYNLRETELTETKQLEEVFEKVHDCFSKLQKDIMNDVITPDKITRQIEEGINNLKINVSNHHIENIRKEEEYIKFLYLVSNQSKTNTRSIKLAAGLNKALQYFHESHMFYAFLTNLLEKLSNYDIQLNRNNYSTINIKKLRDLFDSPLGNIIKEYGGIKDIKLNIPKLNLLNRILDLKLKYNVETACVDTNKLLVKGQFIILSDAINNKCDGEIKFIQLFALEKVFIDTSLDLTGKEVQLAIAAPEWEVVGSPKITLDGKSGAEHYPHEASSGSYDGSDGDNGLPGNPGGPAGSFLGIGKHFIKGNFLEISANGGSGGWGQGGGDGAEGPNGKQCTWCKTDNSILFTFFYNTGDTVMPGGKGGNGGNGGVGGHGGSRGNIIIKQVGPHPTGFNVKISATEGRKGGSGKGGRGGSGGRYYVKKLRNYVVLITTESSDVMDEWAPHGIRGIDGYNREGLQATWSPTESLIPSSVKSNFVSYLKENLNNNPKESYLKNFVNDVETHKMKKRNAIDPKMVKIQRNLSQLDNHSSDSINSELQKYIKYADEKINKYTVNKISKRESVSINGDLVNRRWDEITPSASTATSLSRNSFLNTIFNMAIGGIISFKPWTFFDNGNKFSLNEEKLRLDKSDCGVLPLASISPEMALPSQSTDANIDELYPLMQTHSNLLLWDLVIKVLAGKNAPHTCEKKGGHQETADFASQLAYSYYAPKNYVNNREMSP